MWWRVSMMTWLKRGMLWASAPLTCGGRRSSYMWWRMAGAPLTSGGAWPALLVHVVAHGRRSGRPPLLHRLAQRMAGSCLMGARVPPHCWLTPLPPSPPPPPCSLCVARWWPACALACTLWRPLTRAWQVGGEVLQCRMADFVCCVCVGGGGLL